MNPVVTLEYEHGTDQRFHICVDDHCYVLYCERDGVARQVTHWFTEAVQALFDLGVLPDEAREQQRKRPHLHVVQ